MNHTQSCLSKAILDRIGHDEILPDDLRGIEDHVSQCEHCRRLFAEVTVEPAWAEAILPVLRDQSRDRPGAGDEASNNEADQWIGNESVLRLLGPTDDPRMLGRIGPYEVTGIIGRGGMGVVFKAFDAALNRFVAIKMLLPHLASSGSARQRFSREGQAAAAVIDDCVLPIYCVDEWQGIPYIVSQYSSGTSLQKRIHEQGPLELKEILRISLQVARGLAAAHTQGLVHRDVKPSNILLDSTVERALLTDFGLARAVDDASITRSGTIAGTPQFMAPEQARGESVDQRSDLFSLGTVMYAMCTGHPPFRAESSYGVMRRITDEEPRPIREINPEIPHWLCRCIAKLMAKRPADRFGSAGQVSILLEECLAHVQHPTSVPLPQQIVFQEAENDRPARFSRRNLAIAVTVIGSVTLAVAIAQQIGKPERVKDPGDIAAKPLAKPNQTTAEDAGEDLTITVDQMGSVIGERAMSAKRAVIRLSATKLTRARKEQLSWGLERHGLRAAYSLIPHRDSYVVGERLKQLFVVYNSSQRSVEVTATPWSSTELSHLSAVDEHGKTISVRRENYSGAMPLNTCILNPGESIEVPLRDLSIGAKDFPHPRPDTLEASSGQTCRIHGKLNIHQLHSAETAEDAVDIWLETGDFVFSVTENNAKHNTGQIESTSINDINQRLADLPVTVQHDFAGDGMPPDRFDVRAQDANKRVVAAPAGIHVSHPGQPGYSSSSIETRMRVHGNFEVTVSFEDFHFTPCDDGSSAISLTAILDNDVHTHCSVQRGARNDARKPTWHFIQSEFVHSPARDPGVSWLGTGPEEATSGRLRLARVGDKLHCLFAAGDSAEFRLIHTDTAGSEDLLFGGVRLNTGVQSNGSEHGATSVVWKDLTIRAERITDWLGEDDAVSEENVSDRGQSQ